MKINFNLFKKSKMVEVKISKEKIVDLHMHTKCSDGDLSPKEIIDMAKKNNVSAIAITDHDNVKAYTEDIFEYAKEKGVELVPGIEISTRTKDKRKYHVLGINIDYKNRELLEVLKNLEEKRFEYLKLSKEKIKNTGFDMDEKYLSFEDGLPTKTHIARSVVRCDSNLEKLKSIFNYCPSEGEFIEKYMLLGQEAYIEQGDPFTPEMAIDIIHKSGGVAILAHPAFCVMKGENFLELCDYFKSINIDGFEAINVQYDKSNNEKEFDMVEDFKSYCLKNNLLISGGSDFHTNGTHMGKIVTLGMLNTKYKVDYSILEEIKERSLSYKVTS